MKLKLTVCLSLLVLLFSSLPLAGKFLEVNEAPVKSDAIILLTGGGIERHIKSVELYNKGVAPLLIISNGLEDNLYDAVMALGVPKNKILLENQADSTLTNAVYTLQIMKAHKLKSAIVVSSDYHMRRVKENFDRVYSGAGIRLTYCAADTGYGDVLWFTNQRDIETTFNEYVKLLGNAVGLNGIEDKKPLEIINNLIFKN